MQHPLLSFAVLCLLATPLAASEEIDDIKLPPEITPAVREACEDDVRRLCIREGSTVASVKSCVMSKYFKLGQRCRKEIASAGLTP